MPFNFAFLLSKTYCSIFFCSATEKHSACLSKIFGRLIRSAVYSDNSPDICAVLSEFCIIDITALTKLDDNPLPVRLLPVASKSEINLCKTIGCKSFNA